MSHFFSPLLFKGSFMQIFSLSLTSEITSLVESEEY